MTAYPDLRRGAEHRTDRNSGKVGQLVRDKSFDGVKEPADCGAAGSCYTQMSLTLFHNGH
jgi:hypothetical protein